MESIIEGVTKILDKYLKNGVYKYSLDVLILKSTAIARQTETVKSPNTDYSFNLKIKNGFGITVVVNCHAFKVG